MRSSFLILGVLGLAVAAKADYQILDSFNTAQGPQILNTGSATNLVYGDMIGGDRLLTTTVTENLYGLEANTQIKGGRLLSSNDVGVKSNFQVGYGFKEEGGTIFEEDLNLTGVQNFLVKAGYASEGGNLTISLRSSNNGVFSYSSASKYLYDTSYYGYPADYTQDLYYTASDFGLTSFDEIDQILLTGSTTQYGSDNVLVEFGINNNTNPVPEPGLMIAAGIGALAAFRRRKSA